MAGLVPSGNIRELPPDELDAMPMQGVEPEDDKATTIIVDPTTGHVTHLDEDGGMTIDTQPNAKPKKDPKASKFDDNLAEDMEQADLDSLGQSIWEGVESDLKTRGDFERIFEKAIDLLGLKMEEASRRRHGFQNP